MLKSKEQLVKELGEYYAKFWNNYKDCIFLRCNRTFTNLKDVKAECFATEAFFESYNFLGFFIKNGRYETWRTQQSDWKSTNGLVLYDRFGTKVTFNEDGTYELKPTDVGLNHFHLKNDNIFHFTNTEEERTYSLKNIENLFPPKIIW
jgi:hypothetical protein